MSLFDNDYDKDDALEAYRAGKNPPEYGAGQNDDDFLFGKPTGSESYVNNFDAFSNPQMGGFGSQQGQQNQQQNPKGSLEDRLVDGSIDLSKKAIKGLGGFLTDLWGTFKMTTPQGWLRTWVQLRTYGLWFTIAGFITWILGIFMPVIANSTWLLIFGVVIGVSGLAMSILLAEKTKEWIDKEGMEGTTTDDLRPIGSSDVLTQTEEPQEETLAMGYDFNEEPDEEDSSFYEGLEEDPDDEDMVDLSSYYGDDDFDVIEEEKPVDVDEAIQELDLAAPGMQSRIYLYEQFSKILSTITPKYSKFEEVFPENSVFDKYATLLMNSSSKEGFTEEDYRLEHIYENSFMYKLVISANTRFKAERVATSIENQEKYNDMGFEVQPNLFVTNKVIGDKVHIDIIKNEMPLLTVKDMWLNNKEFFQDSSNVMPVALGSSELGESIMIDFYRVEGLVVAGMKRTGKTWLAQSIITQLAMFNSPNQVQFVIADPKGEQGDFASMNFPHILKRVQSEKDTLDLLRWVMNEEAPRRMALLGQYGLSNIKDLRRLHPETNMPFLFVVVEEMMSLGNHLSKQDKDAYKEYRMIISEIVNKFAYIGVRLFGLSQRLVDEAVPKDAKVGLDLRISAGADASEIEQGMETKPKDFPYNISGKVGKYAVRTPEYKGGRTSFMIGSVLAPNNEGNRAAHRFVEAIWNKLEPRKEVETAESLVAKEFKSASSSEMDDILNSDIQLW